MLKQYLLSFVSAVALVCATNMALAAGVGSDVKNNPLPADNESATEDLRQLVTMPDKARAIVLIEMKDHLLALNDIFASLAVNDFAAASEAAEKRLGNSSSGRNWILARGQGPGRFMPEGMRQLGFGLKASASELAQVLKQGDSAKTFAALQTVSSGCVACHMSYRIR